MPYIHFTEEQKRQANAVDLVEFLRFKGEPLIRSGPEFRMSNNHSVTVQGNEWYDHAAEKGGGPVSFLKEFYGMNYQEAVLTLLNEDVSQLCSPVTKPKGVYRKGTGTPRKQQAVRPQAAQGRGKGRAEVILTVVYHRQPNMERGLILCRQ